VSRGRHAEVVIVGGGLEGVEALGEILRRYRACGSPLRIHVVEAQERLLPDGPAVLDGTLRRLCSPYDVVFHTAARVSCVDADAVTLDSGERLRSDATIWTGGPAGAALLAESGLAPRTGSWAPVTETLQSTVCPEIFVAGDACDLPTPISKQAYHAIDSGACAGGNVVRLLSGEPLRAFAPAAKPMLIAFGDLSCFLVYGRIVLAGAAFAAVKESVFHLVMAQYDQAGLADAVPRGVLRVAQAVRMLLWPTVSSLEALLRQARIAVLR
jgi:NADH dehydrogenase